MYAPGKPGAYIFGKRREEKGRNGKTGAMPDKTAV